MSLQAADNLELKSDNLELKTQLSLFSVGRQRSRYQQAKIRFGCVRSCIGLFKRRKKARDAEVERLSEGSAQECA
jgi:hypothetical protein